MDDTKHTANFLVTSFLLSKRSLKNIYGLNPSSIVILRYICDSIDLNFKVRKKFQTKLSQSQIMQYCHCSERTVRDHIHHLVKKRLIKYTSKKCLFELGLILTAPANSAGAIDTGKKRQKERWGQILPLSNSSNFTNSKSRSSSYQNQKLQDVRSSVENQSTSFKKITKSEAEFSIDEKNHHDKCRIEAMKKAGVKKYLTLENKK